MTRGPVLSTLRQRHYALEALPETITVPACAPHRPRATVTPVEDATLDDIAFALGAVEAEFNAVGDRLHALRKLYHLARAAGGLGAERAIEVLVRGGR